MKLAPKADTPSGPRILRNPYPSPSSSRCPNACAIELAGFRRDGLLVGRRVAREDRLRDLHAQRRPEAEEGLDPLRALVVAVEDVLPREADSAVHLDRALAGRHRRV